MNEELWLKIRVAADEATKALSKLSSALKEGLKDTARSGEQSAQRVQSAFSTLGLRMSGEVRKEIESVRQAFQVIKNSGEISAKDVSRAYQQAAQRIIQLNKEIQNSHTRLGTTIKTIWSNLKNSWIEVGATLYGFKKGFDALRGAVSFSADFEQAMANVQSVAGATEEELTRLRKAAEEMGMQTAFSASQAASAQYYLASAGMNTEQIISSLRGTMLLAGATQSDLSFTSETIAATLSQFGLSAKEADRVANVFAATISSSQATMQKLADSMRYAGPVAKALGYSLEETTAALGLLYNAGFRGEQAGTILRGALSRLVDPPKEAAKELERLGIVLTDSQGKMLPLVEIIRQFERANISAGTAARIFGLEAGPGMMALIGQGSQALENMTQKITGTNKAVEMYLTQMKTTRGALLELRSALEAATITIGSALAPTVVALSEKIKWLVNLFNSLDEGTKTLVVQLSVGIGVFGTLAVIGGIVARQILNIKQALDMLGGGTSLLRGKLGLLGRAFLVVQAAMLGWKIGTYISKLQWGTKTVGEHVIAFYEWVEKVIKKIKAFVQSAYDSGRAFVQEFIKGVKDAAQGLVQTVSDMLSAVREYLPFSPAKIGPLSDLDKAGSAIPGTLADGVRRGKEELTRAVQDMLAQIRGTVSSEATYTGAIGIQPGMPVLAGSEGPETTLEAAYNKYQTELERLREYYNQRSILIATSLQNEAQLEAQYSALKQQFMRVENRLRLQMYSSMFSAASEFFNNLYTATGSSSKKIFELQKKFSIAQALINTYEGFTKALAQGGFFGMAMAATVLAAGMAKVAQIRAMRPGGGGTGGGGGTSVSGRMSYGGSANVSGTSVPQITIHINNPLTSDSVEWERIAEEYITPAIKRVVERNIEIM